MKVMQDSKNIFPIHNQTLKGLALRGAGIGLANMPFCMLEELPNALIYINALAIASVFFYAANTDAKKDKEVEKRAEILENQKKLFTIKSQ